MKDVDRILNYFICKHIFALKSLISYLNAETDYTDATVVTINGKQAYIRNQSTDKTVLYSPIEKKNLEPRKETEILSTYCKTLVHDHETALYQFGNLHGECIVHLMRYLKRIQKIVIMYEIIKRTIYCFFKISRLDLITT